MSASDQGEDELLPTIEARVDQIEGFATLPHIEQIVWIVYFVTKELGQPSITGSGVDRLRAKLKLPRVKSDGFLSNYSRGRSARFLKRNVGYVLTRNEEQRLKVLLPRRDTTPPSEPTLVAETRVPRAVVLTALRLEFEAVELLLTDHAEVVHPAGTVYQRGRFAAPQRSWDVFLVEVGAGNARAAVEAERAINHFEPDVALFLGIAGGVKDVDLGDVVVGTKVYGYESGRDGSEFRPRPDVGRSSYRLEQRAKAEARGVGWDKTAPTLYGKPKVHIGPIAAGEKVVASRRSTVAGFLKRWYSDTLAIEMEGKGFLEATHSNHLDAAVIRGISDLLSGKTRADKKGWQPKAAANAAAFAMHLLGQFTPPRLQVRATNIA